MTDPTPAEVIALNAVCPHCSLTDVSFERTCSNSACSAYAQAETVYEGWNAPDAGEVRTYREGVESEWQGIETAPKDATQQKEGTRILLLWPNGEISIGRWRFNHRTNTYYFTDSDEWDDYETADYPPTHWHPLPSPPAAAIRKLP